MSRLKQGPPRARTERAGGAERKPPAVRTQRSALGFVLSGPTSSRYAVGKKKDRKETKKGEQDRESERARERERKGVRMNE